VVICKIDSDNDRLTYSDADGRQHTGCMVDAIVTVDDKPAARSDLGKNMSVEIEVRGGAVLRIKANSKK
jgi:hypothetical protein